MTFIDSALLNLTEWFCRQFQLLTGRTNVWLAVQFTNLNIIVYFVWAGLYFWSGGVAARIALGLFCSGLLYALTQTIFKVPIEAYENDAYRRVAKGFRNPRRVRDARLRISFLTLSFVLFYPILIVHLKLRVPMALPTYSLIVLTTVVLYLLACDPLPPCAGRLNAWLRRSAPSRLAASESVRSRGFSQLSGHDTRFPSFSVRPGSKNRRVPASSSRRTSDHRPSLGTREFRLRRGALRQAPP